MLKSCGNTALFVILKITTPRGTLLGFTWKLELKVVTVTVVVARAALRVACADAVRRAAWAGITRAATAARDTERMVVRMSMSALPFICHLRSCWGGSRP